ncbi:NADH dehydrogenase [ubiquinone] 1 alpha subcomplex subunit 2 isoform X2 [Drosophila hydei]|uniref:NADH dehydrogenase [ubiquinone] 1 alpha subcomplex subunit 2 n=1 Tax=Drosophila hydei TaxID=7224 RepID=A0A6J1LTY7_DROHY|nr:NADH dehydrogenase [ubiquinone] 1 alpha subcomplex subunit 2 isoform X2 [Drosophila hydei]
MRVGPVLFTQFTAKLKEVRIILDPTCKASKGARKYVERFYPSLKKNNPNLAILVRECAGVQPKLWARFDNSHFRKRQGSVNPLGQPIRSRYS